MLEVIPAILARDFTDLTAKVAHTAGFVAHVHLDVCDGKFTPHSCWPYSRHDDNFEKIIAEEEGLPRWEDVDYEIDLMIRNPEDEIHNWIIAGADRLIVHYESVPDFAATLAAIRKEIGYRRDSFLGVALDLKTPVSAIEPLLAELDFVHFMSIKTIGFQGNPFAPEVLEKISTFRKAHPEAIISVDGGVSPDTAPELVAAGCNRLVSGSAILESDNPAEVIRQMQEI